eukprot:TRINITY_DN1815_c0_g1_i10.p1 TRINITY_DN1815_c0_g1~~TRINITY_DN1815_c0_g1_i10.p1  ORF type:complete len:770 (+),score=243.25 TRINITY_DN1815_c0_g1_i10:176-2311(+)
MSPQIGSVALNAGINFPSIPPMSSATFSFVYSFSRDVESQVSSSQEMYIVSPMDHFGGSSTRVVVHIDGSILWMLVDLKKLVFEIGLPGENPIRTYDCTSSCGRYGHTGGSRFYTRWLSTSGLAVGTEYYIRVKFYSAFTITATSVATFMGRSTSLSITKPHYTDHGTNTVPDYPLGDSYKLITHYNSGTLPDKIVYYRAYKDDSVVYNNYIGEVATPSGCTSGCDYEIDYGFTDLVVSQLMIIKAIAYKETTPLSVATQVFQITEQNVGPTDITLSKYDLNENIWSSTQIIAYIYTADGNSADEHTYELLDSEHKIYFSIPEGQDIILMARYFNYELIQKAYIRIRSTDNYGLSTEKDITISINDINDQPGYPTLDGDEVFENSKTGTVVGTLNVVDQDCCDTHTYEVTSGTQYFKTSGNKLVVAGSINFEYNESLLISVRVRDNRGSHRTSGFTINVKNVNEHPWFLDLYDNGVYMPNPSVDENVPVGTVIYKVTCSGPDKNQEVGSDEQQNLTITLPIDGDGFFKVVKDGSTHTLMVAQEGLNYEEKYLYPIEIKCCDSGNLCRSRAYKIRVKDVPEAPTAVDAAFSVEENSRVDTFIGVVPALAEGPKILMTFSITSGNNFNAFDINACGGALYVGSDVLNYESAETRNFVLEVTIKTALSVTVKVYIGVLDVNEPPSLEDYEITIDENTSIGTVVATKENASKICI